MEGIPLVDSILCKTPLLVVSYLTVKHLIDKTNTFLRDKYFILCINWTWLSNYLFITGLQHVKRIVCILCLVSCDIRKPR